jgi:hypothetical protein
MKHDLALTGAPQLAERARGGLRKVASGEDKTIDGWLEYGAALNEGRRMFPEGDNVRFSAWVATCNLQFEVLANDRAAAMWAARHRADFTDTKMFHPNVRTVRGLHEKWKEAEGLRKAAPLDLPTTDLETLMGGIDTGPRLGDLRAAIKLRAVVDHANTGKVEREAARNILPQKPEALR